MSYWYGSSAGKRPKPQSQQIRGINLLKWCGALSERISRALVAGTRPIRAAEQFALRGRKPPLFTGPAPCRHSSGGSRSDISANILSPSGLCPEGRVCPETPTFTQKVGRHGSLADETDVQRRDPDNKEGKHQEFAFGFPIGLMIQESAEQFNG